MKAQGLLVVIAGLVFFAALPAAEPAPSSEPPVSERIIAELIQQLESNKFDERQKASEMLRGLGKPVVEPLKKVLAKNPNLETTTRVRSILRGLTRESKSRELREQLATLVDLPEGIPANSSLRDCLDFLQDRYGFQTLVNDKAFHAIGISKPEEEGLTLPKMKGVRLGTVLNRLVGQLKGEGGHGTFVIRGDLVEITTTKQTRPREWVGENRELAPQVTVEFASESLEDALRELAELSGINVVLDPREAEQGWKPVKIVLNEVPVDTAVRLLADMAGLKTVAMDNVLYVTSKKNAGELEAEIKEREKTGNILEDGNRGEKKEKEKE